MRFSALVLTVSGLLMLGGCAQMDSVFGRGYGPEVSGPVLKPGGPQVAKNAEKNKQANNRRSTGARSVSRNEGGIGWNLFGGYADTTAVTVYEPVMPKAPPMASVDYKDVTVYPVDGEMGPYTDMHFDFKTGTPSAMISALLSPMPVETPVPPMTVGAMPAHQLTFAHGSSIVSAEGRRQLKQLASDVRGTGKDYHIRVVGHASPDTGIDDTAQSRAINEKMAQKRADSVARELAAAGLNMTWISVTSMGDSAVGERRVDIFVEAVR